MMKYEHDWKAFLQDTTGFNQSHTETVAVHVQVLYT